MLLVTMTMMVSFLKRCEKRLHSIEVQMNIWKVFRRNKNMLITVGGKAVNLKRHALEGACWVCFIEFCSWTGLVMDDVVS